MEVQKYISLWQNSQLCHLQPQLSSHNVEKKPKKQKADNSRFSQVNSLSFNVMDAQLNPLDMWKPLKISCSWTGDICLPLSSASALTRVTTVVMTFNDCCCILNSIIWPLNSFKSSVRQELLPQLRKVRFLNGGCAQTACTDSKQASPSPRNTADPTGHVSHEAVAPLFSPLS